MRRPIDWLARIGLLIIAIVLISLVIYSRSNDTPSIPNVSANPALIEIK